MSLQQTGGRNLSDSTSLTPEQERLVLDTMGYARRIAIVHASKYTIEREDAISVATVGLIQAAKRFDPTKNNNFEKYAYRRISGAIMDEVRKNLMVSRRDRAKGKKIKMRSFDETHVDTGQPLIELSDYEGTPELGIDLKMAMSTLSVREQKVMWAIAHGSTSKEIGEQLGVSESRVCQIASKARTKLAKELT
jgi:RNA polymerase sigma factor (sigma-70 family)